MPRTPTHLDRGFSFPQNGNFLIAKRKKEHYMPWIDAFIPIEHDNREIMKQNTWGHLAPKKNKTYKGRIVFVAGIFGSDHLNPVSTYCEFDDLDSSPWFFDHLEDFMRSTKPKAGVVYEFLGTFRNYKFKGKIREVFDSAKIET
jgi:hypothetical protein